MYDKSRRRPRRCIMCLSTAPLARSRERRDHPRSNATMKQSWNIQNRALIDGGNNAIAFYSPSAYASGGVNWSGLFNKERGSRSNLILFFQSRVKYHATLCFATAVYLKSALWRKHIRYGWIRNTRSQIRKLNRLKIYADVYIRDIYLILLWYFQLYYENRMYSDT